MDCWKKQKRIGVLKKANNGTPRTRERIKQSNKSNKQSEKIISTQIWQFVCTNYKIVPTAKILSIAMHCRTKQNLIRQFCKANKGTPCVPTTIKKSKHTDKWNPQLKATIKQKKTKQTENFYAKTDSLFVQISKLLPPRKSYILLLQIRILLPRHKS